MVNAGGYYLIHFLEERGFESLPVTDSLSSVEYTF